MSCGYKQQGPGAKMKTISRYFAALAATLMLAAPAMAVEEIPVEDFFKRSLFTSFQLSPDGQYLAAVTPLFENDRRNIAVINLETREAAAITGVKDRDVTGYMWANDDRILFFMDNDGNESFGIFAVNKDGSKPRTLIEPAETQIRGGSFVVLTASVLNTLEDDKDEVLVSVPRQYHDTVVQDVKRMNICNGKMRNVARNPGNIAGWLSNDDGEIIGAVALEDAGGVQGGRGRLHARVAQRRRRAHVGALQYHAGRRGARQGRHLRVRPREQEARQAHLRASGGGRGRRGRLGRQGRRRDGHLQRRQARLPLRGRGVGADDDVHQGRIPGETGFPVQRHGGRGQVRLHGLE